MSIFFKKIALFVSFYIVLVLVVVHHLYGAAVRGEDVIVLIDRQMQDKTGSEIVEECVLPHISHRAAFNFYASYLDLYDRPIRAGRYVLEDGMSVVQIVRMLKLGLQKPLRVTFNNVRSHQDIAGKVAAQLSADSLAILQGIKDLGLEYFVPNTYEMWWTATPEEFQQRMKKEYESFWTAERDEKRKAMKMSRKQVSTLASIVYEESKVVEEMPRIAGVYVNRLRRGMLLQADPTVKYALGDFSLKRILHKHLTVQSPYNTYKNKGLPPSPISVPSVAAIDAVLNYEKHNFYYFCARPELNGLHNFSTTYSQHLRNARAYSAALNKLNL